MIENKSKIIFITTGLGVGGAEKQLALLATGLRERDFEVLIISLSKWKTDRMHPDFEGHRIIQFNLKFRLGWFVTLIAFLNTCRVEKPHIMQGWMYGGNIAASVARMFVKSHVYHSIRSSNMDNERYAQQVWTNAKLSPAASAIVINSHKGLDVHALLGFPKDKMLVIPNGIDCEALLPNEESRRLTREGLGIKPDDRVFLYVSRLDPMKGHNQLIASAKLTPEVKYIFVGEGTDILEVPSNILCLGKRQDLASIYNAADWLINWSNYGEGFPNVIAEAMACGLPVFANDVGDSWFIMGETGFKSVAKAPQEIAKDIQLVADKPVSSRSKAIISSRIRENFTVERMIDAYTGLYNSANKVP